MTGSKGEAMTQRDWLSRKQVEHIKRVSDKDHVWDASSMDNLEYEETQALCSMALAYLDAQEWRPMDTAPGDGTRVLLLGPDWPHVGVGYVEEVLGGEFRWERNEKLAFPEGWLPLPQPPKEKP